MMKKRQSQVDQLINLLVEDFRKGLHLPFDAVSHRCPDKKKKCKKRHAVKVIISYNKENDTFHILDYAMHSSIPMFENDYSENIVKEIIKRRTKETTTGKKPHLSVKDLKKLIDEKRINKAKFRSFRYTVYEDEKLATAAKERNMELSDFIRMRLFSDEVPPVLL